MLASAEQDSAIVQHEREISAVHAGKFPDKPPNDRGWSTAANVVPRGADISNVTIWAGSRLMNGAVKARKHEAILSGATRVFVREGFDGTSMEQVAREAKVAKPTLYSHFPNKGALYVATVENALRSVRNEIAEPRLAELSARKGLLVVANQLTDLFGRHDSAVHLCRIAVGGFERFPLATAAIMDAGPRRGTEKVRVLLRVWCGRGELTVDDEQIAAQQLVELCKVSIFDNRLFGSHEKVPVAQCERVARAAHDTFMARYGA